MNDPTPPLHNPRTSVLSALMGAAWSGQDGSPRLLVVGCGQGIEAAVLAQDLNAQVVGIDIEGHFDPRAVERVTLQLGDAMALTFDDASFDIVYSFHALEHITDPHRALSEMHRVLRPGGLGCIGTPNRARLVDYVGGNSTWKQKLAWNLGRLAHAPARTLSQRIRGPRGLHERGAARHASQPFQRRRRHYAALLPRPVPAPARYGALAEHYRPGPGGVPQRLFHRAPMTSLVWTLTRLRTMRAREVA